MCKLLGKLEAGASVCALRWVQLLPQSLAEDNWLRGLFIC